MLFRNTTIDGVYTIEIESHFDDRGFFARTWCKAEFKERGLNPDLAQCNISFNHKKGTLRGMHFQSHPHAEAKLIRCTKGKIYDVALDLRPHSPTYKKWCSALLSAENREMIYIPEGCAHGFLTLEDETEIFYQMSEFYHPESAGGLRWNDPAFEIRWPAPVEVISERDSAYPLFK